MLEGRKRKKPVYTFKFTLPAAWFRECSFIREFYDRIELITRLDTAHECTKSSLQVQFRRYHLVGGGDPIKIVPRSLLCVLSRDSVYTAVQSNI